MSAVTSGAAQAVTLPNGLKVVLVEDHSFPVVSCLTWYKVGARNESPGATGISHILEHLLFHNVGQFRKGELGATIVRNGGQFNGFSSDDFTVFYETLPPPSLDLALRIEAARMREAHFTEADLKEEIANIEKEFEKESKEPVETLIGQVRELAYQQHPYHHPTRGWRSDTQQLTIKEVKDYYDRYYHPNNATLVVTGNFQTKAALALIEKHFGKIERSGAEPAEPHVVEPIQLGERRITMHSPIKKEAVHIAYHAPSVAEADAPAMVVLEKLLNCPFAGRLRTKLIDSKTATYAHCAFDLQKDAGLFTITASPSSSVSAHKMQEAVDGMVEQLRTQPLPESEVKRAKAQAEFAFLSERDGPYRLGFHIGYFDSLQNWQSAYSWAERLRGVSSVDVQRVAKRYLVSDNRVVGWLNPSQGAPSAAPKPAPAAPSTSPAKLMKPPAAALLMPSRMAGYKESDKTVAPGKALINSGTGFDTVEKMTRQMGEQSRPEGSAPAAPLPAESQAAAGGTPALRSTSPDAGGTPAVQGQKSRPEGSGPSAGTTPAPQPIEIPTPQRRVLKNGLTVVVFESHLSPIVEIAGGIQRGDVFDAESKKGTSRVITALFNLGSGKYSHSQMIALQADLGLNQQAILKFEPGLESIKFHTRCLSRDLPVQFNMIGSILKDPLLQDGDVEKAKQDAGTAIRQSEDRIAGKVERVLLRTLLAPSGGYYPLDPQEWVKSIGALKTADVKDFYSRMIAPDATTIVFSGDITADKAAQLAEGAFEGWSAKGVKKLPVAEANARKVLKSAIPVRDRTDAVVCIGKLLSSTQQDQEQEYAHLLLADCALANHPIFSRLAQGLNNESNLSDFLSLDELRSKLLNLPRATVWYISMPMQPNAVPRATNAMQSELKRFVKTGVTAEELAEAKRYMGGQLAVDKMSTVQDSAEALLNATMSGLGSDFYGRVLGKMKQVSLDGINRYVRGQFKPDQSLLVIAGNKQAIDGAHPINRSPQLNKAQLPSSH